MSWRETLEIISDPYTHNAHNTQKSSRTGNCEYSADSAVGGHKIKSEPATEVAQHPKNSDSSQCATQDVGEVLKSLGREYSVTLWWLHQFVIDEFDIDCIKKGDLPMDCLRAHIEYHLNDQREWEELKQKINHREVT